MPDLDDLLQQKLNALENGASLEMVMAELPAEAAELIPLLQLAASVRALPQPEMSLAEAHAGEQKVLAASQDATRPAPRRPVGAAQPKTARGLAWNWRSAPVMGGLLALFLVAFLVLGGLAIRAVGPAGTHAATIMDVTGQVEVASAETAGDWRPVESGDSLREGERIRTGGASSATLVFYEGSRSTVGANSDLKLTHVEGGWGKLLRVLVDQYAGRTVNSVVPFRNAGSSFLVRTPSGSATVHGTQFNVEIGQKGETRFAVSRGKVLVYNDQSQVFVHAGQVTLARFDDSIENPAYQFTAQGALETIDGNVWTVAGVTFEVNEQTTLNGSFAIQQRVLVVGHMDEQGARVADRIEAAPGEAVTASFSGKVEAMGEAAWQIGGQAVQVQPGTTELAEGVSLGDTVLVTFAVQPDGQWLAAKIEPLNEQPNQPTELPSATPDPDAKPGLEFAPDELETVGCEDSYSLQGTLVNTASEAKDYAAGVSLGYLISRGGEYVSGVSVEPQGWAVIQPGQAVNFNIRVSVTPDYRETKGSQKQIKVRVFLASETNRPDHLEGRLTATIVSNCKQEEATATGSVTATITGTPLATPTFSGTPTPAGTTTTCTGADPHPEGMRLAQRYQVSYEEIMGWFCQNFGIGEIDLAYTLSQQSGKPVAEIFAMRRSGMGWGEIKKLLEPKQPDNAPKDNPGGGKPEKTPKPKPNKK